MKIFHGFLVLALMCAACNAHKTKNEERQRNEAQFGSIDSSLAHPATAHTDSGTGAISKNKPDTAGWLHKAFKEDITALPAAIARFVAKGYTAIDTCSGDLDLDSIPDMLLVLKKNGEEKTSEFPDAPSHRPLLLLTGKGDGTFNLAARNDNVVLCIDCGGAMGDAFMGLVIKKGFFSIEHYGGSNWRWSQTITFRYDAAAKHWFLHKDGHEDFEAGENEKKEVKILTKKDFGLVRFEDYNVYKD
jgi:hypothetical protein